MPCINSTHIFWHSCKTRCIEATVLKSNFANCAHRSFVCFSLRVFWGVFATQQPHTALESLSVCVYVCLSVFQPPGNMSVINTRLTITCVSCLKLNARTCCQHNLHLHSHERLRLARTRGAYTHNCKSIAARENEIIANERFCVRVGCMHEENKRTGGTEWMCKMFIST